MRKKLFGKLLSVALSATMAVTSAVPAYAATGDLALTETESDPEATAEETEEAAEDVTNASEPENESEEKAENGEGGEAEPEEVQDEEAVKEEETTEEVTEKTTEDGVAAEEGATLEGEVVEDEELAELESTDDIIINFAYTGQVRALDPNTTNGATEIFGTSYKVTYNGKDYNNAILYDSTQPLKLELKPVKGYQFKDITKITAGYEYYTDSLKSETLGTSFYSIALDENEQVATLEVSADVMSDIKTKHKSTSTDNKPAITFTAATGTTEAATFFPVIDPETINYSAEDPALKLTYNYFTNTTLVLKDFNDFPLSDVEVYLGEISEDNKQEEATSTTVEAKKPYYFESSTKKLTLLKAFVDGAYENDKNIYIVGVSDGFTIKQDDENATEYGTVLKFTQNSAPITNSRSVMYTKPIYIMRGTDPANCVGRVMIGAEVTYTFANGLSKTETLPVTMVGTINEGKLENNGNHVRSIIVKGIYSELVQYIDT